jgi:hypothetical protein
MKRITIAILAMMCLLLPMTALASGDHDKMDKKMDMDHGKMKGMDHDKMGMKMDKDTIMLENEVVDGVMGMGHLKDVQAAIAKMKMKETHHFAIMFQDAKSKKHISEGQAALKIESPNGETGKAIMLMGMQGHFGADIVLPEKGEYHFYVATKLADGKKRKYHFSYDFK